MGKIIKENGKIWDLEIQTLDGKHRKMTLIGFYDENEEEKEVKEEKPTKKKRQKKTEE